MKKIRIAIGQINATVGDIESNLLKICKLTKKAEKQGADIIVFPELATTGYPPEDLLLRPDFIKRNIEAVEKLKKESGGIIIIAGFADKRDKYLYNAAALICNDKIIGVYHKILLPNYSVFDEKRYFTSGKNYPVFAFDGVHFGITVCEDIWSEAGPVKKLAENGAGLIINISASPYHPGKIGNREQIVKKHCLKHGICFCYANLTGGQDELLFDGNSFVADKEGRIVNRAEAFQEDLLITDITVNTVKKGTKKNRVIRIPHAIKKKKTAVSMIQPELISRKAEIYKGLTAGLKDYVFKNGFSKVLIGLSGGIDSAIVAAIAADAIGKDNVIGVFMPSRFTSGESEEDASQLAENLGIELKTIPIEDIFRVYAKTLAREFKQTKTDITEENLQARIRGNILMALSNKFGHLVLVTGNKSETSVGYSTIYGDMAGGFGVIKDVYKTLVYELAEYRNSLSSVIPERIITKEPSAELRFGQKDSDTLPPYDTLDKILKLYIEEEKSFAEIVEAGFKKDVVRTIIKMVDKSEYKRRQAPPGIRITPKAFGKDRRIPITNRYTP